MIKTAKISSKEIVMIIAAILCFIVAAFAQDSIITLYNIKGKIVLSNTTKLDAQLYINNQPSTETYYLGKWHKNQPNKELRCRLALKVREEDKPQIL